MKQTFSVNQKLKTALLGQPIPFCPSQKAGLRVFYWNYLEH